MLLRVSHEGRREERAMTVVAASAWGKAGQGRGGRRERRAMNKQNLGLYGKYHVERTDGSSRLGGKHARCDYFVLDLTHDKRALSALRAYAEACEAECPRLAADLRRCVEFAKAAREESSDDRA